MDALLAGSGSEVPAGGCTVTVFAIAPEVPAGTVPASVITTCCPESRSTLVAMSPVPAAGAHCAAGMHVQVKAAMGAGRVSETGALVTFEGPAFETVIV